MCAEIKGRPVPYEAVAYPASRITSWKPSASRCDWSPSCRRRKRANSSQPRVNKRFIERCLPPFLGEEWIGIGSTAQSRGNCRQVPWFSARRSARLGKIHGEISESTQLPGSRPDNLLNKRSIKQFQTKIEQFRSPKQKGDTTMAVDMFLKLDGIKGESKDSQAQGRNSHRVLQLGIEPNRCPRHGWRRWCRQGVRSRHLDHASSSISRPAALHALVLRWQAHSSGLITVRKAGEKPLEYLKIKLTDILISGVQDGRVTAAIC